MVVVNSYVKCVCFDWGLKSHAEICDFLPQYGANSHMGLIVTWG